jgi:hypothetical protein
MPFIDDLLIYKNPVFLETGSHHGDTIYKIANNTIYNPLKIYSLELSDVFFDMCQKRFENNNNIYLCKANSKYDLYNIIKDIDTTITFWLDSHWSGCPDVGCDIVTVCPILEELEQIKQHSIKTHTIIIDDIRLMNNSSDKYTGFPVTLNEILTKIIEINPEYKIKYYDDCTASNDILVAYIEEKQCIHNYLNICKTNHQPPGLADFLRGTIALYNFSKLYDYKLLIDSNHPLFKFLKPNDKFILSDPSLEVIELLPPLSYDDIYNKCNQIFNNGKTFSIITNSFYNLENRILSNFGPISNDCRDYLKSILSPSDEIENKIKDIFNSIYNINIENGFKVIHLRFGDNYLHNNIFDENLYQSYFNKISILVNQNPNIKFILLSDSSKMANKLKEDIPLINYWDNSKVHLGDLKNNTETSVFDTLVDFFIMSKCNEILVVNNSGFSNVVSLIYNINYTYF